MKGERRAARNFKIAVCIDLDFTFQMIRLREEPLISLQMTRLPEIPSIGLRYAGYGFIRINPLAVAHESWGKALEKASLEDCALVGFLIGGAVGNELKADIKKGDSIRDLPTSSYTCRLPSDQCEETLDQSSM